jgi:thiamine-monophosphate kinase
MKLAELGEFRLIDVLSKTVDDSRDSQLPQQKNIVIGIGDDTAAWKNTRGITLATTDCLVENIHFRQGQTSWRDLGWKALAVNLSDIAAMGGTPEHALVTIGLPHDLEMEPVIDLYKGILEAGNTFGVAIAGGDTTSSKTIFISITLTGSSGKQMLKRSSARPGDLIAVTGHPGMAAAGFKLINGKLGNSEFDSPLKQAFLRPYPRIAEGNVILSAGGRTAIDISDGLMADLQHICGSSGTGACIHTDLIPIHPAVRKAFPSQALDLALGGGEDYELLFAADAGVIEKVRKRTATEVTIIGEITAGPASVVRAVDANGSPYQLENTGWEHFGKF